MKTPEKAAAPSGPGITVGVEAGVGTITLVNPTKRNALTRGMCQDIAAAAADLDDRPDVDVVAVRGTGGTFSAGVFIGELRDVILDQDGRTDHLTAADQALARVGKPTIAVVQGHCMGGGWQLASACDFIFASTDASFGITPAKLGIIYPRAGIDRLVRLLGPATAKYVLMSARTFGAPRAREMGLVAEVVPADGFEDSVRELFTELTARSRYSMHTTKELIDRATDPATDPAELAGAWETAWTEMAAGPDIDEGVAAFLERRDPDFGWRPGR
ncbi:MAG: enoyl-CoA hydratase/isomerase family protein [Micrococcaceae bacterium]|uniref:enoyl-CoA hydratase/isomerase family protein n=1 Tax=Arthrobacter sp. 179 TaxID=3457734 RepID=UPI00264F67C5|nr:enoyl-CoA hydratase/isomerase family protein [Micrococcaceae bacterium]MDN5905522.1 enoyl-CoA hydratase/isomerase family protein [Micrococcaceae bacterium]MDN6178557.1 enoyl-CoA hydratase/isomerase family protein [Micrococcaceae bacterium]MDN6298778.1 enoyl-CoA hydratase/isomerase family protein [Micrococcaceae bacterium]